MKVELAAQVRNLIRDCPPEPRRWIRTALLKLASEKGDIKALERELSGYYRLRIRAYRIIFRYATERGQRKILCDFAERRDVVYETFLDLLR
jgi:mRNA interferase RelE/StbE